MIETLVAAGIFTLVGSVGAYHAATRKVARVETPIESLDKSFICPYCENVVTGFKELDLIHHVACIGKSQADLEAEAKKPKKNKDEYFIKWGTRYRRAGENFDLFNYNSDSGSWWVHTWELYRNGEKIDSGASKDADYAKKMVKQAQDFDEHQRRTGG